MNNYLKYILFLCIGSLAIACDSSDDKDGDWMKSIEFRGVVRVGAVSFKIGDDVYVGLGHDEERLYGEKEMRDFYRFDAATESWAEVDSFPGEGRYGAVAFVIGNKAYVGTGYRPERNNFTQSPWTGNDTVIKQDKKYYNDFYVFDGETQSWDTIPLGESNSALKFPGKGIRYGVAFSVAGKGYVGTGAVDANTVVNDFYSFDPQNGWADAKFPGDSRKGATAFVIGDSAIVCLGVADSYRTDVWLLRGKTGEWVRKNPLVNRSSHGYDDSYSKIQRAYAGSFVSDIHAGKDGQLGYVVCGLGDYNRTCWTYSMRRDRWYDVTSLPSQMASPKVAPVAFSVNGYGFITTGGSSVETAKYRDTWKFIPGIEEDDYNDY